MTIFAGQILVSGCGVIGAILIATNSTCKVKINNKYLKSSCEISNGVMFEKLTVINTDSVGTPNDYIVTERFQIYNSDFSGKNKPSIKKLYFNKINDTYKWVADTVNIHYKVKGRRREIISSDKFMGNSNSQFISKSNKFELCPIQFAKDTWYNIKITDARLSKTLLYVDKLNVFHVHQFDSGSSPI